MMRMPFANLKARKGEGSYRNGAIVRAGFHSRWRVSMQEVLLNSILSHYHIIAKLGAGGMGEVYRARDTRLDREVAIKVLPASFASNPDRLRRFIQEAKAASALNHP